MAKCNFVKKAQKNIFTFGKQVEYLSKLGKREGEILSKTDKTMPRDENDNVFIYKGDSYYWWQFKIRPKQYSKNRPKASQLTQSTYNCSLFLIIEQIEDFSSEYASEVVDFLSSIISDLQDLLESTQESLDNIPENLQSSPTAELLTERVDSISAAIDELENIDVDYQSLDSEQVQNLIADENSFDTSNEDWRLKITEELFNNKFSILESEWVKEKLLEIELTTFS